jgi:hypothetical protein
VRENGAAVQVVPGSTQQAIPFLIGNTGNDTHGFLLAGVHNPGALDPFGGAADDFTPTTIQTYVDTDGNGVLDPAEIAATNSYIPSFAPGAGTATGGLSTGVEIRVFVVSDIPLVDDTSNPLANGDIAVVSLVAHAANDGTDGTAGTAISIDDNGHFTTGGTFTNGAAVVANASGSAVTNPDDPTTMETVFNDGAFTDGVTGPTVDGTGIANDIVSNAQFSSYSSYTVQTAALTVAKAATTLYDPVNAAVSPKAIPGAYVTYSISVANAAGAADAALTTLSDALPAELVLDPDFVLNDGSTPTSGTAGDSIQVVKGATTIYCTAAADGDGCDYAANTVSVDFTNATFAAIMPLAATETVTVNFNGIVQ